MAAVIVSLYMIWTGGRICVNSLKVLLDATIGKDTLDRVRNIALSNPAVKRVDSLVGRNSGRYRFIELYFEPFTSDPFTKSVLTFTSRAAELMRRALEYCIMFDKPVMNHCEVRELSHGVDVLIVTAGIATEEAMRAAATAFNAKFCP